MKFNLGDTKMWISSLITAEMINDNNTVEIKTESIKRNHCRKYKLFTTVEIKTESIQSYS